jgi:hypothetical protein
VEIVELLGLISYKIITTDGTLFIRMPGIGVEHTSAKNVTSLSLKEALKMFIEKSAAA